MQDLFRRVAGLPGWPVQHIRGLQADYETQNYIYLSAEEHRELAAELAKVLGWTAAKHAGAKTRRPPVQLVALVLLWLILVAGPLAEGRLPNEIQTMLSTEVGTVALGFTITQMMKRK